LGVRLRLGSCGREESGLRRTALIVPLEKPGPRKTSDDTENDRQRDCVSNHILLANSRFAYKRVVQGLVGVGGGRLGVKYKDEALSSGRRTIFGAVCVRQPGN
jgi:hypothetical protein